MTTFNDTTAKIGSKAAQKIFYMVYGIWYVVYGMKMAFTVYSHMIHMHHTQAVYNVVHLFFVHLFSCAHCAAYIMHVQIEFMIIKSKLYF